MSNLATTTASASAKPKKVHKPKANSSNPTYISMILTALKSLDAKKGSSKQAILSYVTSSYKFDNEKKANLYLNNALRNGVASGVLKQVKGRGAHGSFKLGDKPKKSKPRKSRDAKPKKAKLAVPKKAKVTKAEAKSKTKSATSNDAKKSVATKAKAAAKSKAKSEPPKAEQ